jgi:predicted nucleotidyltransferase
MDQIDVAARSTLAEALDGLCERFQLAAIYAFGSRAAEAAQRVAGQVPAAEYSASDLDIGVLPERNARLRVREKVELAIAIEDLFGVARVDLVSLPDAGAFLARDIVCGELLWARDLRAEARYQLYAMRRAADLAPYARRQLEAWLDGESVVQ